VISLQAMSCRLPSNPPKPVSSLWPSRNAGSRHNELRLHHELSWISLDANVMPFSGRLQYGRSTRRLASFGTGARARARSRALAELVLPLGKSAPALGVPVGRHLIARIGSPRYYPGGRQLVRASQLAANFIDQ